MAVSRGPRPHRRNRRPSPRRLQIESLEPRLVLSAAPYNPADLSLLAASGDASAAAAAGYHTYTTLTQALQTYASSYPSITRLVDVGVSIKTPAAPTFTSVQGRHLWALEISDNPGQDEVGEPEVAYIASMHGNEPVGMASGTTTAIR